MDIKTLDLNLLRLFDAIWRARSVSRAAEELGLSQPAARTGLARTLTTVPRRTERNAISFSLFS